MRETCERISGWYAMRSNTRLGGRFVEANALRLSGQPPAFGSLPLNPNYEGLKMPSALDRRFQSFLAALPGAESLDEVLAGPEFDGERRADYLLFGRRVILELKSLEVDTSTKVETEMDIHRDRDDFPVIYGDVDIQKILKHLPDGQQINDRIFNKVTRSVETACRSAEEQIYNTARLLNLPEAVGFLVLLNEDIKILEPKIVVARLSSLLLRKDAQGAPKSPISFSWLLFESHVLIDGPVDKTTPLITLEGPRSAEYPWFDELLMYLQVAWANFNGRNLIHQKAETLDDLSVSASHPKPNPRLGDKVSKQELWELHYAERPYLRQLSDDEVLRFGADASQAMGPHFLVGGTKLPAPELESLMVAWSNFLAEVRHRGLDIRRMPKAQPL